VSNRSVDDSGTGPGPLASARAALPSAPERALARLPDHEEDDDPAIAAVRGRALAAADRDGAQKVLTRALDHAESLPDHGRACCRAMADLLAATSADTERAARYRWATAALACGATGPFAGAQVVAPTVRSAPHSGAWVDAAALVVAADALAEEPGATADPDPAVREAAAAARTGIPRAPDPPDPTLEVLTVAAVTAAATPPPEREWDLGVAVAARDWPTLRERVLASVERTAVAVRDP
jgi:hypothetical protein